MQKPTIRQAYSAETSNDVSDLVLETTRHPLQRLEEVPVDQQYANELTELLEAHGATVSQQYAKTYERRGLTWVELRSEYIGYAINFPAGTTRAYKLRMRATAPFIISFPDGYQLHGAEISPLFPRQKPLIILYLPRA